MNTSVGCGGSSLISRAALWEASGRSSLVPSKYFTGTLQEEVPQATFESPSKSLEGQQQKDALPPCAGDLLVGLPEIIVQVQALHKHRCVFNGQVCMSQRLTKGTRTSASKAA